MKNYQAVKKQLEANKKSIEKNNEKFKNKNNKSKEIREVLEKYETTEQNSLVKVDNENIDIENVSKPLVTLADNTLKHDTVKLGLEIMNILAR